jgi:hypothetical protein
MLGLTLVTAIVGIAMLMVAVAAFAYEIGKDVGRIS